MLAGAADTENPTQAMKAASRASSHGDTVATSVCSGEAFAVRAGTEHSGAALNRRGVHLPGNMSRSCQPTLLHWGSQHCLRAPAKFKYSLSFPDE